MDGGMDVMPNGMRVDDDVPPPGLYASLLLNKATVSQQDLTCSLQLA